MYNYLGVVYIVEPATSEMKAWIEKDKFVREEILIPAVSKFTCIRFLFYHVFSQFDVIVITSGWSCKEGEWEDDQKEEEEYDDQPSAYRLTIYR